MRVYEILKSLVVPIDPMRMEVVQATVQPLGTATPVPIDPMRMEVVQATVQPLGTATHSSPGMRGGMLICVAVITTKKLQILSEKQAI